MSLKGQANEKCNLLLQKLVRNWMAKQGPLSYRDFANLTGVSNCYMHRIKSGHLNRGFTLAFAIRILGVLGITLSEFDRLLKRTTLEDAIPSPDQSGK